MCGELLPPNGLDATRRCGRGITCYAQSPSRRSVMVVSSVVIATSLNKKFSPEPGARILFHAVPPDLYRRPYRSDGISLEPLTEQPVPLTRTDGQLPIPTFCFTLAGGFPELFPGAGSQSMICAPCQAWTTYSSR